MTRGDTSHPKEFVPTPAQWRYLREFLSQDGPVSLKLIAARANVNWRTVYDWREDERYVAWFTSECSRHFLHTLPLIRRVTEKFALAGSPEHIKLVMQWAGISNAGTNDQQRPATMGVFINVPRPEQIVEAPAVQLLDPAPDTAVVAEVTSPSSESRNV